MASTKINRRSLMNKRGRSCDIINSQINNIQMEYIRFRTQYNRLVNIFDRYCNLPLHYEPSSLAFDLFGDLDQITEIFMRYIDVTSNNLSQNLINEILSFSDKLLIYKDQIENNFFPNKNDFLCKLKDDINEHFHFYSLLDPSSYAPYLRKIFMSISSTSSSTSTLMSLNSPFEDHISTIIKNAFDSCSDDLSIFALYISDSIILPGLIKIIPINFEDFQNILKTPYFKKNYNWIQINNKTFLISFERLKQYFNEIINTQEKISFPLESKTLSLQDFVNNLKTKIFSIKMEMGYPLFKILLEHQYTYADKNKDTFISFQFDNEKDNEKEVKIVLNNKEFILDNASSASSLISKHYLKKEISAIISNMFIFSPKGIVASEKLLDKITKDISDISKETLIKYFNQEKEQLFDSIKREQEIDIFIFSDNEKEYYIYIEKAIGFIIQTLSHPQDYVSRLENLFKPISSHLIYTILKKPECREAFLNAFQHPIEAEIIKIETQHSNYNSSTYLFLNLNKFVQTIYQQVFFTNKRSGIHGLYQLEDIKDFTIKNSKTIQFIKENGIDIQSIVEKLIDSLLSEIRNKYQEEFKVYKKIQEYKKKKKSQIMEFIIHIPLFNKYLLEQVNIYSDWTILCSHFSPYFTPEEIFDHLAQIFINVIPEMQIS